MPFSVDLAGGSIFGRNTGEVPTLEEHNQKADKSELINKASIAVENEFRDDRTGFWATRNWVERIHKSIFDKTFEMDKKKEPGLIHRIDSLYELKADKTYVVQSFDTITDKINSGGGIRNALSPIMEEHLGQISSECKKYEDTIRSSVKEHIEVSNNITRLMDKYIEFVNTKIGDLKEHLESYSSNFTAIKKELSSKQEIITGQLNESSQKHSTLNFLSNEIEMKINNAISLINIQADNFTKDAEERFKKIRDISDSADQNIKNKRVEIDSLFKSQLAEIDDLRKCIQLEFNKYSADIVEINRFKHMGLIGRIKWILTGEIV